MAVATPPSTSNHHHPHPHHQQVQQLSISDIQMSEHSLTESDTSQSHQISESQETEMQETQPVDDVGLSSQERREKEEREERTWGTLHPCTTSVSRIDFLKPMSSYSFGRDPQKNDFVFGAGKISNHHCTFTYDTRTDEVSIHDHSSNGTYVSSSKVGKGKSRILREGNEISLGPPTGAAEKEDFRWLYHHVGVRKPEAQDGIWAKYDLGAELGRGTFASVFRCMDKNTGKWYAVKIIQRSRFLANPINERNFGREINLLTWMSHPNIVQLIEVFEDPETIYLVMEEVSGGELLMRITARNGLPEAEAKYVAYQVCHAMAYIHDQGITHRDLKPENVLLTNESPPIAKVADFGLAKLVDEGTFLKTMCGTPSYLAPEVVIRDPDNDTGYNHLVDSWSMGVICFAMVTNTSPFVENADADIRTRIATRIIHWETLIDSGLSEEGIDFIVQLLRTDPNERMSLEEALQHVWLRDLTVALRSPPPSPPRPPPGQLPVPRHYSGMTTMGTNTMNALDQSTAHMSTVSTIANNGDSPSQPNQSLPEDYSQEFDKLRLDSEEAYTPIKEPRLMSLFEVETNSQGELKVPGFSPWSKESQERFLRSQNGVAGSAASGSGANDDANDVEISAKPSSRKRKTNEPSAFEDRDSSPLTEPPAEGDSDDSSEESHKMYDLPTRQSKSTKRAAGDSPSVGSHSKPTSSTKYRSGTGRAGTRKAVPSTSTPATSKTSGDKGKGKGKAVETDAVATEEPATSSGKVPLRRSTRKSAK